MSKTDVPKFKIENTLISDFIKKLRTETPYSSKQMGEKLGYAASSYNGYETGKTKNIEMETLDRILEVLFNESGNRSKYQSKKAYIVNKINETLRTYNKEKLQNEVWFHALYLKYIDVPTVYFESLCNRLMKEYRKTGWDDIFSTLNNNNSIENYDDYPVKNEFYIEPITELEREAKRCPVPKICYELTKEDIEKMQDDIFEESHTLSIGIVFMLFFNLGIIKGKNDQEAFKYACQELHILQVPNIYEELDMVEDLVPIKSTKLHSYDINLFKDLRDFFDNIDISAEDDSLKMLQLNLSTMSLGRKFMDIVALDFSFIEKLSTGNVNELERRIKATVNNFRNELGM